MKRRMIGMMAALMPALMLALTAVTTAQETAPASGIDVGGFGWGGLEATMILDHGALLAGGGAGIVLDHHYRLGLCAFGLTNDVHGQGKIPETQRALNLGLGGLLVEYAAAPDALFQCMFHLMIGGGGVSYSGPVAETDPMAQKISGGSTDVVISFRPTLDAFFAMQPGVGLELKVMPFLRVEGSVDYRMVSGVELDGLTDRRLSGLLYGLGVKVGSF
jgi:hypothetical protein